PRGGRPRRLLGRRERRRRGAGGAQARPGRARRHVDPRRGGALHLQGDLYQMGGGVSMGFATDCIHAGQEPEPVTGAVTYPIFQTSTYVQPRLGENKGYEYARTKNPTRSVLEANLAALERGKHGHCFASGMSAIDVVFR